MTTIEKLEKAFWKLTNKYNIKYYNAIEEDLRVLDILHKHIKWQGSLQYVLSMSKYWEGERKSVTQERLDNYGFPFTVDEFETIARWLRRREELK